jgi:hypothetical protein
MFNSADHLHRIAFSPFTLFGQVFGPGGTLGWTNRYSRTHNLFFFRPYTHSATVYPKKGRQYIVVKPWAWGDPVIYTNSVEILKHTADGGTATPWRKPQWYESDLS